MQSREVANLGIVRPPLVYLVSIAIGLALHLAWPIRFLPQWLSLPLGAATIAVAVIVFILSVRTFRIAGTPVPGNQPTTAIVRAGPYRYSRNPIYLAFSLLQLGIAFWINGFSLLLTLIPAVLLMSLVVIPREEAYLEARFPAEYLPYKNSVRRWI
ncbi:MAG TPA: isoprenylcysteine carboxylmethyltransferase family protein [Gemmatimonadales bacterium]